MGKFSIQPQPIEFEPDGTLDLDKVVQVVTVPRGIAAKEYWKEKGGGFMTAIVCVADALGGNNYWLG